MPDFAMNDFVLLGVPFYPPYCGINFSNKLSAGPSR